MNTQLLAMEKENKKKGMRNSIIIHLLLLLIAWFYMFPVTEKKEAYPPPVVVDFTFEESSLSKYAKEDVGKKRAKTKEVKKVETTPTEVKVEETVVPPIPNTPVKETSIPSEPVVAEVMDEESPVEAVEEEMILDEPEEEIIPDPVVEEPVEVVKEVKNPIDKTPITKNGGDSKTGVENPSSIDGEDDGTGKGNTGDGQGADKGNDGDSGLGDEGAGTGEYDGSGNGVFGRRVIYRNTTRVLAVGFENQIGKTIVAKFCVNRAGKITYAEILDDMTDAIIPLGKEKQVLRGIYGYKVEPDLKAPREQCGMLKIKLTKIDALH